MAWRDHWIVGGQGPAAAVFVGAHIVARAQVALEHLQRMAVFEADDVVFATDLLIGTAGLSFSSERISGTPERLDGPVNRTDDVRKAFSSHRVVRHKRRHDFRSHSGVTHRLVAQNCLMLLACFLPTRPNCSSSTRDIVR